MEIETFRQIVTLYAKQMKRHSPFLLLCVMLCPVASGSSEQRVEKESAQEAAPANPRTKQVAEPVVVDDAPKHPAEANGTKHKALGVIHGVVCSYPAVIEFSLEASGKKLKLYNNNFAKIDLTVVGFTPPNSMNPCKDFEGIRARVQYAESSDKSVDGKVLAVELRK